MAPTVLQIHTLMLAELRTNKLPYLQVFVTSQVLGQKCGHPETKDQGCDNVLPGQIPHTFKMLGTDYPLKQHHVLEEQNA